MTKIDKDQQRVFSKISQFARMCRPILFCTLYKIRGRERHDMVTLFTFSPFAFTWSFIIALKKSDYNRTMMTFFMLCRSPRDSCHRIFFSPKIFLTGDFNTIGLDFCLNHCYIDGTRLFLHKNRLGIFNY